MRYHFLLFQVFSTLNLEEKSSWKLNQASMKHYQEIITNIPHQMTEKGGCQEWFIVTGESCARLWETLISFS